MATESEAFLIGCFYHRVSYNPSPGVVMDAASLLWPPLSEPDLGCFPHCVVSLLGLMSPNKARTGKAPTDRRLTSFPGSDFTSGLSPQKSCDVVHRDFIGVYGRPPPKTVHAGSGQSVDCLSQSFKTRCTALT